MDDTSRDSDPADVTYLLQAMAAGDSEASGELLLRVYDDLKGMANRYMSSERAGHTLQPTALVHEAYLRLVRNPKLGAADRSHFYFAAAEAMRRVLIDHARKCAAKKRGAGQRVVSPERIEDLADLASTDNGEEILAVDDAIQRLEKEDPRAASVVRLRFFAGLSVEETAETLGASVRTVQREWAYARARLFEVLKGRGS